MNREIKFRGRQMDFPTGKDNGKWVLGYLVRQLDMGEYERWWITDDWDGNQNFEVIPESIGQFTGLKDKNGVEIYEGDIVSAYGGEYCQGYWEHSGIFEVKWQGTGFDLVDKNNCGMGWGFCDGIKYIGVIGNICEHPHLIK